jgi:CheY-like chemotaxis protein
MKNKPVLIVHNNSRNLAVLHSVLDELGLKSIETCSAIEALHLALTFDVFALVLDLEDNALPAFAAHCSVILTATPLPKKTGVSHLFYRKSRKLPE